MSAKIVSLDFELCSTLDLTDVGTYEWTTNKNTHPYSRGLRARSRRAASASTSRIDLMRRNAACRRADARAALDAVAQGAEIHAWNANFEFNVWNNICVPRFKWPALGIERFHCTMCAAACAGLPMSLDQAALAVGSPHVKDKAGSLNMMRMARPRSKNPLRWWHEEDPAKLQATDRLLPRRCAGPSGRFTSASRR